MSQQKPVRSLDSLASLISDKDKEVLRQEEEKRQKQLKKAGEIIGGIKKDAKVKKISDKEFNDKYDFLKQSKEKWNAGTDKGGDYIIHAEFKYYRLT